MIRKLYKNDSYNTKLHGGDVSNSLYDYSFAIHSTIFLVKMLIVDEFLISDEMKFHITCLEYDNPFFKQLMFGLGI